MKQPAVLVMLITFVVVVSFVVASQEANKDGSVTATLTGANEVNDLGDADGSGVFKFTVKNQERQICYDLTVSDIAIATAATINFGARGSNGSAVLSLNPPATGRSQGCVPAREEIIADIASNPTRYYVNVTNVEFPKGAIRGQLK